MAISEDQLKRIQAWASIASSIAIPVVLAITGFLVQRQLSSEGLKKDYVSIAASILNNNPTGQEPELRQWAVTVLDANSPIPFSAKAKQGLREGSTLTVVAAPPAIPEPPSDCLVPPTDRDLDTRLKRMVSKIESAGSAKEALRILQAFVEYAVKAEEHVLTDQARLRCLQHFAKILKDFDEDYRKSMGFESSRAVFERIERERAASAPKPSSSTAN